MSHPQLDAEGRFQQHERAPSTKLQLHNHTTETLPVIVKSLVQACIRTDQDPSSLESNAVAEAALLQIVRTQDFEAQLTALETLLGAYKCCEKSAQQQKNQLLTRLLKAFVACPWISSLVSEASRYSGVELTCLSCVGLPAETLATLALASFESLCHNSEGLLLVGEAADTQDYSLPVSICINLLAHLSRCFEEGWEHSEKPLRFVEDCLRAHITEISCEEACVLHCFPRVSPELNSDVQLLEGNMGPSIDIVTAVEELGPPCSLSKSDFKDVLQQCGGMDEATAGRLLAAVVSYSSAGAVDPSSLLDGEPEGAGEAAVDSSNSFNVDAVSDGLKESFPSLDWGGIVAGLDCDKFLLKDRRGFVELVGAVKRGTGKDEFPLDAFLSSVWSNPAGQLSFLFHAVSAPPEVISFQSCGRVAAPLEGLHGGKSPIGTPNHAWLNLELLETLAKLSEAGQSPGVHAMLEHPLKHCPEVLLAGMAASRPEAGQLRKDICAALLPTFVMNHPNSSVVLHRVWPLNSEAVMAAMADLYAQDHMAVSRVLDVCQELKVLTEVLGSVAFPFALELAALAARREYLNLEKWLQDRLVSYGLPFIMACLEFLNAKIMHGAVDAAPGGAQPLGQVLLSADVQAHLIHFLNSNLSAMPSEAQELLKRLQQGQATPPLGSAHQAAGSGGPGELQAAAGAGQEAFAPDIEEEANSHFQKIYMSQMTIDEVVAMLKRFKTSADPREQEVFACMIHNLFDEYRFFPKYPDKELHITAVLFGALIHHQLVSSITLGIALRYVLDALRKPFGTKMFKFGIEAVNEFRSSLGQWSQYSQHILQIPHVQQTQQELCTYIEQQLAEAAARGPSQVPLPAKVNNADSAGGGSQLSGEPEAERGDKGAAEARAGNPSSLDNQSLGGVAQDLLKDLPVTSSEKERPEDSAGATALPVAVSLPMEPTSTTAAAASPTPSSAALPSISHLSGSLAGGAGAAPSFASTINAETLEQAAEQWQDFPQPEEAVQDKVHFMINNLAKANLEQKSQEVKKLVSDEHIPWFANYMVVKRAAQEPNFHQLYLLLLDKMADTKVYQLTVRTTHSCVKILMRSERIKTDIGERSLLKNLGSFLGQLTIARNKPVLQKDLDMKAIVLEAYSHGKMIAVIPFVHKVLESCTESKIFKPPNPWLMGILSLLSEIYALDKLKLNLKFEIEMLFKDLHLQIADVSPSDLLRGRYREVGPSNPDFSIDKSALLARESTMAAQEVVKGMGDAKPTMASAASSDGRQQGVLDAALGGSVQGVTTPSAGGDQQMQLNAFVTINPSLGMVAERLQLKRVVPVAVDRAICEIITPVVERSVTIACMTTQELIMKDFAMEPDEARMRNAAHQMVSSLAGSLALVTCKEPLRVSLTNQLKQLLTPYCSDQGILEHTITVISQDNLDLGCTIIEKAATDKAVRDIDDRLLNCYHVRQKAKSSGQAFYDSKMESLIPATLPDALRPKPGHLNPQQQRVYDDFSRIPRPTGGSAPSLVGAVGSYDGEQADVAHGSSEHMSPEEMLSESFMAWQNMMENFTIKDPSGLFGAQPEGSEGRQLMKQLAYICRQAQGREDLALELAQRIFRRLVAGQPTRMRITAYVTALEVVREAAGYRQLPVDITKWYMFLEEDRRWNRAYLEALMRAHLLHLPEFDIQLAKALSVQPFGPACDLAVHLVRTCMLTHEPVASATELYNTLDVLSKIASRSSRGAPLISLVEQARQVSAMRQVGAMRQPAVGKPPIGAPSNKSDKGDPHGLREQVAGLFDEWVHLLEANPNDRMHTAYVASLQQNGLLKGDELTDRFLRILMELAVAHCLRSEGAAPGMNRPGAMSFVAVDALVHLLKCLILAHHLGATLLAKALVVVTGVLQGDADDRGGAFNSRPYFRLLLGLICELSPSETSDPNGIGYMVAIAAALHALQPLRVPGFAFAWLELVSHRQLMPKLLLSPQTKGRMHFQRLVVALLRFLEPYLRNAQLTEAVRLLYRGTLRVLLVLLHDFPEFLCENHFILCDAIPPSCIQMRNLILSAFPRQMRLPDPFTPNLKVDLLPEISQAPRIQPDPENLLPKQLQAEVDMYLKSRQPASFAAELPARLLRSQQEQAVHGAHYNVPLLNALVLYVGVQAIEAKDGPGATPMMHSPAVDIFQRLSSDLDTEGRYMLFNAVANQLRYPNSHTHYFSCVLLYLFAEAQQEVVQEQITRVLLERLIVNRPHPWGLLITFIELIKNPRYNFWSYSFIRCAADIEKLFESLARSCMPPPPKEDEPQSRA